MKTEDKIRLFDMFVEQLSRFTEDKSLTPKNIGVLNKPQGINGYKRAEVGTPVFDSGERYFLMLESLDGNRNVEISYYKDTLKPVIDFI